MSDIALARPPQECGLARLGARVSRLIGTIELALQARRERRALLGLDDCMLKDLGLNRGSAYAEAARSFWDVPCARARRSGRPPLRDDAKRRRWTDE